MIDTLTNPNEARPATRLAPSPTGALHLGNARSFLINWALARQNNWQVVLRIEDLDSPRVRTGAVDQAREDLSWLGLDWDVDAGHQLADLTPYQQALDRLAAKDVIYPCRCTRKEIQQAQSAPHGDEHDLRYPGTCRPSAAAGSPIARPNLPVATQDAAAWRLRVPDHLVLFEDQVHGPQAVNVQQLVGDFVVATKAGLPAYQLAVVVDDARQGITDVVRGDDLLSSTARQILLWRMLFPTAALPRWWHLPLVLGTDGRRLAKRHGDTRLSFYRDQRVPAERVIGLLACWSGMVAEPEPMTAGQFARRFRLSDLPRQPVTFTADDHAWLMQGAAC